jgi:hypothetical protein
MIIDLILLAASWTDDFHRHLASRVYTRAAVERVDWDPWASRGAARNW